MTRYFWPVVLSLDCTLESLGELINQLIPRTNPWLHKTRISGGVMSVSKVSQVYWMHGQVCEPVLQAVYTKPLNGGWCCPPGDICQCLQIFPVITTRGRACYFISWVEARDTAKHSTLQKAAPPNNHPNKELPSPKCQEHWGWETQYSPSVHLICA